MLKKYSYYSSGLLLVFFWQLFVLFYTPFIGAVPRNTGNFSKSSLTLSIGADETVEDNSLSNGFFVEEVLEEFFHLPENEEYSKLLNPQYHYVFHLLKDYHDVHNEQLMPPEQMI